MNGDLLNSEFYNAYCDEFDKIPFEEILRPIIFNYFSKTNGKILEIGSGPGALAVWMTKLGCKVTCLEPAEKQAEKARLRGLDVRITKLQDYSTDRIFDGIVAISSLIHISRAEMPLQIKRLSQMIKFGGIFIASFMEGNSEEYEDPTGKGKKRFFSKFSEAELSALLVPSFSIVEKHKIDVKRMNQSFFLMVMKSG